MNRQTFLVEAQNLLEMDGPLAPEQVLADIPDYDSLAILNLLSLFDTLGVTATPEQIGEAQTAQDLIDLAGSALSDD